MTIIESSSVSLTDAQWNIAHAIAQTLVKENTDVNEFSKAIAYLRASVQQTDITSRFFKYLKTLVTNGRQIGHSGKTTDYYRSIDKACSEYLKGIENAETMLQILGWASRLMRYYKNAGPIGEIISTTVTISESSRQIEIIAALEGHNFIVGQKVDANVTNIKGKEVTYQIVEGVKLTVKEPKKYADLSVGITVKVEILELKENGVPKKVKCCD